MSNNTQKKLYCIVRFDGKHERRFSSYEEVEELLKKINKYNSKKDTTSLIGNILIEKEDEEYNVSFIKYYKLGEKNNLEDIDKLTITMNPKELLEHFKLNLSVEHDVNLLFFHQTPLGEKKYIKRALYLPILYKDEKDYLDKGYIYSCIKSFANIKDYHFFKELALSLKRCTSPGIEDYYRVINECKSYDRDPHILFDRTVSILKSHFIKKDSYKRNLRDEEGNFITDYRKLRDVATFIIDQDTDRNMFKNSLYYNTPDYTPSYTRKLK